MILKKKEEVNYRKREERLKCCKCCAHKKWIQIYGCDGEPLHHDWRCEIIGCGNSRRYSIEDRHVCDFFKKDEMSHAG